MVTYAVVGCLQLTLKSCFREMSVIDVRAQQIVVDALARGSKNTQKIVLFHTPSKLTAGSDLFLSTQDRLQELFASSSDSTVAVFPNTNLVRRLCKKFQEETFSIELVFACHASSDPNDLVLDLLGKFSVDFKFIQEVSYLAELPERTFRKQQPYIAYVVKITNLFQDSFDLHWYCQTTSSYEALIPKVIADVPDIQELLCDEHGPLTCKSIKRNGCNEIANGGNCTSYVFSSSCIDQVAMDEAIKELMAKCRDCAADFPSSVIQVKPGVIWNTIDLVERSVIFLRSLTSAQVLELAQQLTLNRINFYLPAPKVIVLDLVGVPTASLIRLLHYSEIPVPTSMIQGAFSLSFISCGRSLKDRTSGTKSAKLQHFKVSCGRITAFHNAPMQIKWDDVYLSCKPTIEHSSLAKWLKAEFGVTCLRKVLAINEERTVEWYLQFQVPQKLECKFPKQVLFEKKKLLIDHALPFAPTRSSITRPPIEESMHEHWKNTASLAPAQKKNRSNCIAHFEGCFPSLQRVNMLQEISVRSRGSRMAGSFEISPSPLLFFNGFPELTDGLQAFVGIVSSLPEIAKDVEHSVDQYITRSGSVEEIASHTAVLYGLKLQITDQVPLSIGRILTRRNGCCVSTTELLRCYAYTECLLLVILSRVDSFCTPKRHFEIVARIPVSSPDDRHTQPQDSSLTLLGENPLLSLDQDFGGRSDAFAVGEDGHEEDSEGDGYNGAVTASKHEGSDPQPAAVDGCGDTNQSRRGTSFHVSVVDQYGKDVYTSGPSESPKGLGTGISRKLPQPAAVDGRGGNGSPDITKRDNGAQPIEGVTPTIEWTEKPAFPSPKIDVFQHSISEDANEALIANEGKDMCKGVLRDNDAATPLVGVPHCKQNSALCEGDQIGNAGNGPWVSALSACDILAPIPEADVADVNECSGESSNLTTKPKALPVKASPAARKGLATVATSQTQPVQMRELLNGYVHRPAVEKSTEPTDLTQIEKTSNSDRPSKSVVCSTQSLTAGIQSCSSQGESKEHRTGHKPLRRSKSAGQSPLTPSRRTGTTGNSKSCPPTRLKASPAKEVIKHSGKARNEQAGTGETVKGGPSEKKGKHGQPPLRRAGMDTTRKLSFFSKTNGTPCQSHCPVAGEEKLEGDVYMIDVERLIAADELRKQAVAVEQVRDAGSKWLTQCPEAQRNEIEQLAVSFLLAMNSTLCFFTVAMRMLSKAPWTDPMITPDVRQAAMVAISRGWFVKSENFTKYPFTRAELALAAGAYQGLLVPTIPDDTTVALRTIIDHLPHACATMFTQAEVACPFCQAKRKGIVPTFSCSTTWKQSGWANLKTALEQAQPFLGYIPKGWHKEGCDRDDQCPTVTKLGKWLYLELRPYPVLDNDFFPSLKDTASLLVDESLCDEGLCVDSLVCSNLCAGEGRHYWLVEIKEGRMHQAYDSLQGVQPLTQEVFKMLQVTGILLRAAGCSKPTLRNSQLDRLAGKVDIAQRRQQMIRVASRSRTHKLRNQLVKSMSNLTLAPPKRELRPSQVQLERTTSGDVLCAVPCVAARNQTLGSGVRSCKARKARKRKGITRNNARCRNTSKVLPFCNTTNKGKVSVSVYQDQGLVQQEAAAPDRWNKDRHDGEETAALSDPISENSHNLRSCRKVLPGIERGLMPRRNWNKSLAVKLPMRMKCEGIKVRLVTQLRLILQLTQGKDGKRQTKRVMETKLKA